MACAETMAVGKSEGREEGVPCEKEASSIPAADSAGSMVCAERSAGVAKLSQAMEGIDQTTQQNSALVEQSSAAAQSLKQQADNLVDAVSGFKLETMSA